MPDCGHYPFLQQPQGFLDAIMDQLRVYTARERAAAASTETSPETAFRG